MTVGELRELLACYDQGLPIVTYGRGLEVDGGVQVEAVIDAVLDRVDDTGHGIVWGKTLEGNAGAVVELLTEPAYDSHLTSR